jgi:hypothetical protein
MLFAQNVNPVSHHIGVGFTHGLIASKGDYKLKNANIYGIHVGYSSSKNLTNSIEFNFGINYQLLDIAQYKNQISYFSNWQNHPKVEQKIDLQTAIQQQFIEVPIIIKRRFNKLTVGAGIRLTYLITSLFSQKVMGYYNAPDEFHNNPTQYPNATADFNQSLRFVLETNNNRNISPFHRRNFQPTLNFGYTITDKLGIEWIASYDVLLNPAYLHHQFNPYRIFRQNLILTYQLNKI